MEQLFQTYVMALSGDRGERPPRDDTKSTKKRDRDWDDSKKSTYGPGKVLKSSGEGTTPTVSEDRKRKHEG